MSRYLKSTLYDAGATDGSSTIHEPSASSVEETAGTEDRSSSVVDNDCGGEMGPPPPSFAIDKRCAGNAVVKKPKSQREAKDSGNGKCRKPEKPAWRGPLDWCPTDDRRDLLRSPRMADASKSSLGPQKLKPDRISKVYLNVWPEPVDGKPTVKPSGGVLKASATINRLAKRRDEARMNDILAKKLSAVKPVVSTFWKK